LTKFGLIAQHENTQIDLADLDLADPKVYDMLYRADSVACSKWNPARSWPLAKVSIGHWACRCFRNR
jgi:hypothetical protein